MEKEICNICFEEYISANAKDHQCPDFYSCGACGESCEAEDGTITQDDGFTHKPELCPAQDELEEENK